MPDSSLRKPFRNGLAFSCSIALRTTLLLSQSVCSTWQSCPKTFVLAMESDRPSSNSSSSSSSSSSSNSSSSSSSSSPSSDRRRLASVNRPNEPSHRSLDQQHLQSSVQGTVVFMAVADHFSITSLHGILLQSESETHIHPTLIGTVLHLQRTDFAHRPLSVAFVFSYGCLVVWPNGNDCDFFLSAVIHYALRPRPSPIVEDMQYVVGSTMNVQRDVITLCESDSDALKPDLQRMAVSCALAHSIKLTSFESTMHSTIEGTRHLPEQLAYAGEITASQRDISRLTGRLFLERYQYNLSGDLLVSPRLFSENEAYYAAYKRVEQYLEVSERGEVLDIRIQVVHDLYKFLGDEVSVQRSMALELAITVMIAFEIILTLVSLAKESISSVFLGFLLFFCLVVVCWLLWRLYRRRRSTIIVNNLKASSIR